MIRKKNRVGTCRSVRNFYFFLHYSFGQKCVLCMFYVDWELGGRKKGRVTGNKKSFFRPYHAKCILFIIGNSKNSLNNNIELTPLIFG